jgi:hypothetical protein
MFNTLIKASEWADFVVNPDYGIGARQVVEHTQTRPNRRGVISFHAAMNPVRQVTALSTGLTPGSLQPWSDLSQAWLEGARQQQILFACRPPGMWGPGVQFGGARAGGEVWMEIGYTAGWVATTTTGATAAQSVLPVADATGIMPGDALRLWDPALEEAVIVAPSWVPAFGAANIPIIGTLAFSHAAGASVSGLPARMHQAVISCAVGLLLREDVSSDEPFSNTSFGPSARMSEAGGKAGGLMDEAYRLLLDYARVR